MNKYEDQQVVQSIQPFATEATEIAPPIDELYRRGRDTGETLPAAWYNYFMNAFSINQNRARAALQDMYDELHNVLQLAGVAANDATVYSNRTNLMASIQRIYTAADARLSMINLKPLQEELVAAASRYATITTTTVPAAESSLSTLSTQLDTLSAELTSLANQIKALGGAGGWLNEYNFGTATPSQAQLNTYATAQLGTATIPSNTKVMNMVDNHVWIFNGTAWANSGYFGVGVASTSEYGIVKFSTATPQTSTTAGSAGTANGTVASVDHVHPINPALLKVPTEAGTFGVSKDAAGNVSYQKLESTSYMSSPIRLTTGSGSQSVTLSPGIYRIRVEGGTGRIGTLHTGVDFSGGSASRIGTLNLPGAVGGYTTLCYILPAGAAAPVVSGSDTPHIPNPRNTGFPGLFVAAGGGGGGGASMSYLQLSAASSVFELLSAPDYPSSGGSGARVDFTLEVKQSVKLYIYRGPTGDQGGAAYNYQYYRLTLGGSLSVSGTIGFPTGGPGGSGSLCISPTQANAAASTGYPYVVHEVYMAPARAIAVPYANRRRIEMLAGAITTEANSPFTPVMSPNDRPAGGIGDLLYVLGIYANTGRPNVFATCQDGNTDKFPICYLAGHGGGGWVSSLVSTSGTVARDGLYQPEEGLMLNLGMQREISEYYGANLISPYTGSYYALIQEEIAGCQIPGGHIPYYAYNAGSRGSPLLAAGQPGSSAHSMLTDNTGKSLCLSGGGGRGAHGGRVAISPRSATDAWLYCGYGGGGGVGSLIAAGNLEPYAYVRDYTPGVASTPGMVYGSPDEQGKVYVTGYSS